jgi:hypothetical protein
MIISVDFGQEFVEHNFLYGSMVANWHLNPTFADK